MIMVSANETFKKILNPSGELNVSAYLMSGAAAGALVRCMCALLRWEESRVVDHCCMCDQAGALTNPLDVAKTRLQTQMMVLDESSSSVGTRVASSARSAAPEFQVLTNDLY